MKPDVCENGFMTLKNSNFIPVNLSRLSILFIQAKTTVYRVIMTIQKYFYTSFMIGTWLLNLHTV